MTKPVARTIESAYWSLYILVQWILCKTDQCVRQTKLHKGQGSPVGTV